MARVYTQVQAVAPLLGLGVASILSHRQLALAQHAVVVPMARQVHSYVCKLVSGYIAPDIGGRSVTLALILGIVQIVDVGGPTAWGTLMLAKMYQDLHQIVYHRVGTMGRGFGFAPLLQVWAWEHIAVL